MLQVLQVSEVTTDILHIASNCNKNNKVEFWCEDENNTESVGRLNYYCYLYYRSVNQEQTFHTMIHVITTTIKLSFAVAMYEAQL